MLLRGPWAFLGGVGFGGRGLGSHYNPDPREDPENRSLKGVPIKYPLVVSVPKLRDLKF